MQSSVLTIDQKFTLTRSAAMSSGLWILGFALLTAVGAQVLVPTSPVPFTLQSFVVLLSGALLGARKGAAAQVAYLAMGASGLPVFAGFTGTVLPLMGPTGGYLLAFPLAAWLTGTIFHSTAVSRLPRMAAALVAMVPAMAVVFTLGVAQLNLVIFQNWSASIAAGLTSLQAWDAVKIAAAAGIAAQMTRRARG